MIFSYFDVGYIAFFIFVYYLEHRRNTNVVKIESGPSGTECGVGCDVVHTARRRFPNVASVADHAAVGRGDGRYRNRRQHAPAPRPEARALQGQWAVSSKRKISAKY